MTRNKTRIQAYSTTPWRKQLHLIAVFLLILVFVGITAGIYLNVSAKSVEYGREILDMQDRITRFERINADLQTQLAYMNSTKVMYERARELGFKPINHNQAIYVQVPGYSNDESINLGSLTQNDVVGADVLPDTYTESIFTWIGKQLSRSGSIEENQ